MPRKDTTGERFEGDREPSTVESDETPAIEREADADAPSPAEYVEQVAELATGDPTAAGDHVGNLLAIVREGSARDAAGEVLDAIGWYRPVEFEIWIDDLVAVAESDDPEVAFLGLRSIAQLAATSPRTAAKGLDVAFENLGAPDTQTRQAAFSIVAEVGAHDPDRVARTDRAIAAALDDAAPGVRTAGAMAAGRLLGADPTAFPRTARALVDTLDDEDKKVREYAHVALANYASEHPESVPDRRRAIEALGSVTDSELGLTEGATNDAVAALLGVELGSDVELR